MALLSDNEVQLRISTKAEGQGEVDGLSNSISDLEKDLKAVSQAAAESSQKQSEAAAKLELAKQAQDKIRIALAESRAEYTELSVKVKEGGADQASYAARADESRKQIDTLRVAQSQAAAETAKASVALRSAASQTQNLSAEQVRLAASLSKVSSETLAMGASTKRSADAFATLGMGATSDAAKIEAQILEVNQALMALARSADVTGDQFNAAFSKGKARIAELETQLKKTEGATDAIRGKTSLLSGAMGQLAAAFGGLELARQFIKANVEVESLNRTFKALTGSAEAAGKEMVYITDVSNKLGLAVIDAGKAYASLSASTKGTAAEGKTTRDVFEAVSMSMSVAGKSSADTSGALQALAQMAGKGVVSMEELRQQLAERLPGALNAAASGLGITTAELTNLVSTGRLTANELFPALTKGLNDLYGASAKSGEQTATLTQTWNRFTNTMTEFFASIGDQGGLAAMKVALEALGTTVVVTTNFFFTLGKTIDVFFGALASGDIGIRGFSEKTKAAFREIEEESQARMVGAARNNSLLAASLSDAGQKALKAASDIKTTGDSATASGASAVAASADWTKLNVAYAGLDATIKSSIESSDKNVQAKAAEGAASVALAQAFGTETEQRKAQSAAAEANAVATSAAAERKKEYYAIVAANIESLKAEIEMQGKATEEQSKLITELEKVAASRLAEAEAAVAQANASKLAASQAAASAAATADNSLKIKELQAAYEAAKVAVDSLREAKIAGKDVTEQLTEAERQAGAAALLYRDALSDQIEKITALNTAKQAAISAEQSGINVRIERLKADAEVARAMGDEYTATQNLLEVKRLEVELAHLVAEAKKAEAEAAKLVAQAKIEEIRASGELTQAKEAEIRSLEASVKVKEAEAQIAGITANKLKELADITEQMGDSSLSAARKNNSLADSLDNVAASAAKAAAEKEKLAEASAKADRQPSGMGFTTDSTIRYNILKASQGLTPEEFNKAVAQATQFINEKSAKIGNLDTVTSINALNQAFNDATSAGLGAISKEKEKNKPAEDRGDLKPAQQTMQQAIPKGASQGASTVNVNIAMGGKATQIKVASQQDANALTDLLRRIESDAGRSA